MLTMLLPVIFVHYVGIVSANFDLYSSYFGDIWINHENQTNLIRNPRQIKKKHEFTETAPTCDQVSRTLLTPFVVIVLFGSSGRFLGMGSIIDKKTVLSASQVVEASYHRPKNLLILAGRLSPWWGRDCQVKEVQELFENSYGLVIMSLKHPLEYNRNVLPIRTPNKHIPDIAKNFGKQWAVFGVPRSSWDNPGDPVTKTSIYLMKLEDEIDKKEMVDKCKATYPDMVYNDTYNIYTFANGTFCWGCIGSPTVALNPENKVMQIAVVVRGSTSEIDECHVHVKVSEFEQWIRAHSMIGFKGDK